MINKWSPCKGFFEGSNDIPKAIKKQVMRVLTYLEQCFEAAESQWKERCEEMSCGFFGKIEGGPSDQCSTQLQN